tara:strand:+ start:90656 stop:92635 length:1980 start_codon:yes stop_codon:yes gene_type:complete
MVLGCALFASCEPRKVEIQGLDELTAEIRSQRLQNRQRGASAESAPAFRGEQIKTALAPLRDVLQQLGSSQRELSTRQATLTQELQRWAQLLVQSMPSEQGQPDSNQAERNEEATKLSQRLAALEKTIAEQDQRHRHVEALLGTALDHTADQLEQFLKRVGADIGEPIPTDNQPNPATGASGKDEANANSGATPPPTTGSQPARRAGGNPAGSSRAGGNPAGSSPARGNPAPSSKQPSNTEAGKATGGQSPQKPAPSGGGQTSDSLEAKASQQGSMEWLWGLAGVSLLSGIVLLLTKKRSRPLSMAPEMQYAPQQQPAVDSRPDLAAGFATTANAADDGVGSIDLSEFDVAGSDLAHPEVGGRDADSSDDIAGVDSSDADSHTADTPEVEELWAAAALLGEAIGRLKHTGEAMPPELGGQHPLPEVPHEDPTGAQAEQYSGATADQDANDALDLDEIFVIDEDDEVDAAMFAESEAQPGSDLHADVAAAIDTELGAIQALGFPEQGFEEQRFREQGFPESATLDSATPDSGHTPSDAEDEHSGEPEALAQNNASATPPVSDVANDSAPVQSPYRPPASGQPAARHASSSPVTCRLNLSGDEEAEGRVRRILGRDPRVLVSPAPQVRTGMGELEVSFALLPGLTAGERSLLEQQLRDTVA